jgi:dipeptidase E
MNKYIVAIGGGDIRQLKTLAIDKEIVSLTGKKQPRLLFIPTASSDSESYMQVIKKVYGKKLGCKVDSLLLLREKPNKKEVEEKIFSADIIYVGGGNTLKMMRLWRQLGVDKLLKSAYNKGTILCGISAGAICWFEYGHSDSMSFYHPDNWNYIRVKGMGLLKGILCPHFDGQTRGIKRKKSFSQMIEKIGGVGIAIDNHAAIIFCNNSFRVINSKKGLKAYRLFKKNGKIKRVSIEPSKEFYPLSIIYSKTV